MKQPEMPVNVRQQCENELSNLFQQQIEQLSDLTEYLLNIRSAIAENDLDKLKHLVHEQNIPIAEIESLELEQLAIFKKYKITAHRENMHETIRSIDSNGSSIALWEKLQTVMSDLKQAMEVSQILVSHGQTRVRQSLNILTGRNQGNTNKTYSCEGKAEESSSKRSIAIA